MANQAYHKRDLYSEVTARILRRPRECPAMTASSPMTARVVALRLQAQGG